MIFVDLTRINVTRNFMFFVIKYLVGTKSTKNHQTTGSQRSWCTPSVTKALRCQIRQNYCILGSRLHVKLREGTVPIWNTPNMKKMIRAFQKYNGHFQTPGQKKEMIKRHRALFRQYANQEKGKTVFSHIIFFIITEVYNPKTNPVCTGGLKSIIRTLLIVSPPLHPLTVSILVKVDQNWHKIFVFVPQGVKVNIKYYLEGTQESEIYPANYVTFHGGHKTFQHDSVPAHSSKNHKNGFKLHLRDSVSED